MTRYVKVAVAVGLLSLLVGCGAVVVHPEPVEPVLPEPILFDDFAGFVGSSSSYEDIVLPADWAYNEGRFKAGFQYIVGEQVEGCDGTCLKIVTSGRDDELNGFLMYRWGEPSTIRQDVDVRLRVMATAKTVDMYLPELRLRGETENNVYMGFGFSPDGYFYGPGVSGSSGAKSEIEYETNQWYDVKIEVRFGPKDETTITTYVDGSLVGSFTAEGLRDRLTERRLSASRDSVGAVYVDYIGFYPVD